MLDLKWIRENKEKFIYMLAKRQIDIDVEYLLKLEARNRQIITLAQSLQQAKNEKSKKLAEIGNKEALSFIEIKQDVEHINEKLTELSKELGGSKDLKNILNNLPNLLADEVPEGLDESENKLIRKSGEPVIFPYGKTHEELGKKLAMIDFEQTAKMSGSRFVTLKGKIARLERALINFMLDTHIKNYDFLEISPPVLVRQQAMYHTGQLPKFSEESYLLQGGEYRLIPSGEVPLTNLVADSIMSIGELPKRYVAYTECFRSEAGSAGRDTKGMIRNHQFGKVELVTIATPENSEQEHEYMLIAAEDILKKLKIPYRIKLLCSGDTGFHSQKTYDIEAWMPGQKKYREISSVSNCGDFQARRMKARYKNVNNETKFVHTLNGSGLAVGRTIAAILENYQQEDGSIIIPDNLQNYMDGEKFIKAN